MPPPVNALLASAPALACATSMMPLDQRRLCRSDTRTDVGASSYVTASGTNQTRVPVSARYAANSASSAIVALFQPPDCSSTDRCTAKPVPTSLDDNPQFMRARLKKKSKQVKYSP